MADLTLYLALLISVVYAPPAIRPLVSVAIAFVIAACSSLATMPATGACSPADEPIRSSGDWLIANMTPDTEAGYLGAFMDWWMVYCNEDDMWSVAAAIPSTDLASMRMFRNPGSHIVFLEIVRA